MKTVRLLALTLALLLLCACVPALAEEEEILTCGDFQYRLTDDGGAVLTGYTGPEGEVVIPGKLDGHPVTGVEGNPFFKPEEYRILNCTFKVARDHPSLATIGGVLFCKTDRRLVYCPPSAQGPYEIPQGIESIGERAFYRCIGLTGVTIPDSVTTIGDYAFRNCTNLTSVSIPDGVTSIGYGVFSDCTDLTSVTIPDSVTSIGVGAFYGCTGLTSVTIPVSVTSIGERAFSACVRLKTIAVSPGNPVYADLDGVLYTKALDSLVACPGGR
ncbi:MAG: leucine-rich repeat domain-containing protein, partial [Clostridia bacterium]|nr:leucine-rich repeat domain-containing protein [Clostridia bacterium]